MTFRMLGEAMEEMISVSLSPKLVRTNSNSRSFRQGESSADHAPRQSAADLVSLMMGFEACTHTNFSNLQQF